MHTNDNNQARAEWFEALWRDLRFSARLLAKNRGFTAVAVGSLAFGIAVNTSLFAVVNGLFLRPLPYERPDELVDINQPRRVLPLNELRQARSFDGVAAFIPRGFPVAAGGTVKDVFGCRASANLFTVLGVRPALGRTFAPDEDDKPVVMLSYEYWRQLSGDPDFIGQAILIGDDRYTVIGVLPADFTLWFRDANLWIPYRMTEGRPVARLKRGVSLVQAEAETAAIVHGLPTEPGTGRQQAKTTLSPLSTASGDTSTLWLLQAAVGLVLLIVCVNVSNLLLVRASARRREFAIRAAIGAGRTQVVRQLLTESALLAALGGASGLLLAKWTIHILRSWLPVNIARVLRGADGLSIHHPVLAFTAGVSLLAVLLFGFAPAMSGWRLDVMTCLKDAAAGPVREHQRLSSVLVSGELALAVMLSIGAGLMLKSLAGLQKQYLGFSADHVLRTVVDLEPSHYPRPEQRVAFFDGIVRRLESLPRVESVSVVGRQIFPFGGPRNRGSLFEIQDQPGGEPRADVYVASPHYFRSVRIPLLKGRLFGEADNATAPPVAVIGEIVATHYWGQDDPIGHLIRLDLSRSESPWVMIVGVVGDIRNPLAADPQPMVYRPWAQNPSSEGVLMIRTASDPMALASAIRSEVHAADPTAPEVRIASLEKSVADYVSPQRFTTSVFGVFAAMGLLLAAFGVYGVMRYWVGVRIAEIGVRLALGATPGDVMWMVLGRAATLAVSGVLVGLAGALVFQRWIASQLYGVSPADPAVLSAVSLTMGVVALAAALFPAVGAGRIDPLVALRHE